MKEREKGFIMVVLALGIVIVGLIIVGRLEPTTGLSLAHNVSMTVTGGGVTTYAWSGVNLGALAFLVIIVIMIVSLASSSIFRHYLKAFGYVGKVVLHIFEGFGVYVGGKAIYNSFVYVQDYELLTWDMVINGAKWGCAFLIIGFVAHKIGLRIYGNVKDTMEELK
jgi:hypothetical protein